MSQSCPNGCGYTTAVQGAGNPGSAVVPDRRSHRGRIAGLAQGAFGRVPNPSPQPTQRPVRPAAPEVGQPPPSAAEPAALSQGDKSIGVRFRRGGAGAGMEVLQAAAASGDELAPSLVPGAPSESPAPIPVGAEPMPEPDVSATPSVGELPPPKRSLGGATPRVRTPNAGACALGGVSVQRGARGV